MKHLTLPCAGAGLALLALSLFPARALALGGPCAHATVFFLLLALALLALGLLYRQERTPSRLLVALLPVGLAIFLRAALLDYQSADYQTFLAQWAAAFRDNGGFAAVKLPIGNYNAPYLYFLAFISYLPVPDLYLIKLFSILFDVILAWGGLRLTRHFTVADSVRPLACFCALLVLPTVVLNGACWGQCDALYGGLTLHALASALDRRPKSSLFLLGIAFSFKLQTVFLLPLWGGLWLTRRVKFRHLLLFPAAYALTCVPALLLGKPLADILGVYVGQTQNGIGTLNYNSASVYSFLPYGAQVDEALWARLGILAAFFLVLVVLAVLWLLRKWVDDQTLLTAGVLLAIGVPFLLPYMHDRYFFLADVLTVVWGCTALRRLPVALLVQLASLSAYLVYFRQRFTLIIRLGNAIYPMLAESLLILAALISACVTFNRQLWQNNDKK